jgi:integrase
MVRKRSKENLGLPTRWCRVHGAYYYQVPRGLEHLWDSKRLFRLGTGLSEAYAEWARRVAAPERVQLIGQLLDRYLLQVVPKKKPRTQVGNKENIAALRQVFELVPITALEPQHVYLYADKRSAKTAAHREIEVLSHAFTKAVEWGLLKRHPFKGEVRLTGEPARTRYIEDWEVIEALSLKPMRKAGSVLMIQAYIRIKLLTALRRSDLLRLRPSDFTTAGIKVTPTKTERSTGKRFIIEWTPELTAAVEIAKATRPVDIAPWLFCKTDGDCYIDATGRASGWDSMWQRYMTRVLKETKLTERFTEHDLRAKCGSDAESLERARQLLGHADAKITERVYRRKPEMVRPLR